MYALTLVGQALVLLGIAAASYWGSRHIDPETRIRARTIALDSTMRSRKTALVAIPLIGFLILLGTLAVNESPNRDTIAAMGLALLFVLFLAHWSTVKRAAR